MEICNECGKGIENDWLKSVAGDDCIHEECIPEVE